MTRCQCYTKNNDLCKLKSHFNILEKRYCFTHVKKRFDNIVVLIQKHYRGFRIRNKINRLFIHLPLEIQKIILGYVKESYYINKYNKSIQKVLSNRVKKIQIINNLPVFIEKELNLYFIHLEYYTKFIDLYNLYVKYHSITKPSHDHELNQLVDTIWDIFSKQIGQDRLFNLSGENVINTCNLDKLYMTLYKTLTHFKNIYSYNYPKCRMTKTYVDYIYYD